MWVSEASVASDMTAPGRGCAREVAAARAALAALKAAAAFSDHTSVFGLPRSRSVNGWSVPAIPGTVEMGNIEQVFNFTVKLKIVRDVL
jgi:hypothetical protein